MRRYIGYMRVSTDEQVNGYGLDAQKASIEAFAKAMGYELESIYVDEGISGSTGERPALQEALANIATGDYAGIIVMKLDRMSRNLKDILNWHDDIFVPNKASIVSVKEQFDTSTAIGRLFFQMIGGFAEFERQQIKERVMAGKKEKAQQGKFAGGSAPYGYDLVDGKLMVNNEQAEIVREVYKLRSEGLSLQRIADWLNESHVPTKRGGKWSKVHVKDMLDREQFYRGMYRHGEVVALGEHEPILMKEC